MILDNNKATEIFINSVRTRRVSLNFRQHDGRSEYWFYFHGPGLPYIVHAGIIDDSGSTIFFKMTDIDGYFFSNGMGRFFDNLQNSVKELPVDPKIFDKMSSYRLKRDNKMKRRINSFAELIHRTQIKFKSPQDIIEFFDRMIKYNTAAKDISAHYWPIKEKEGAMEEVYEQLKFIKLRS